MPNAIPSITLSNGVSIPRVGLGTWQCKGAEVRAAVATAVRDSGYRHIDTAIIYRNEADIGETIKTLQIDRKELFITSKLPPTMQGYDEALAAFAESCRQLQTDYVDLFLIHWPGASGKPITSQKNAELRRGSWQALEKLYEEGKIRAIGVSNFEIQHLRELMSYAKIKPHVNQIELHPWFPQKELLQFCEEHGIVVECYSPLAIGKLLDDQNAGVPELRKRVAQHYPNKSLAQLLLRWGLQVSSKTIVLPKSTNHQHIADNLELFDFTITDEDMQFLDSLSEIQRKVCWDPRGVA